MHHATEAFKSASVSKLRVAFCRRGLQIAAALRYQRRLAKLCAMLAKRIIPCLDVKAGRVVKGIQFLGLKDAGDPVEAARFYDLEGADELCFLDITASH